MNKVISSEAAISVEGGGGHGDFRGGGRSFDGYIGGGGYYGGQVALVGDTAPPLVAASAYVRRELRNGSCCCLALLGDVFMATCPFVHGNYSTCDVTLLITVVRFGTHDCSFGYLCFRVS
jgi:hypothetical protein